MLPWLVQTLLRCVEPVRKRLTGSGVLIPRGTPDNPDYEVTDFGKALAASHMGLTLGSKVLEVSRCTRAYVMWCVPTQASGLANHLRPACYNTQEPHAEVHGA